MTYFFILAINFPSYIKEKYLSIYLTVYKIFPFINISSLFPEGLCKNKFAELAPVFRPDLVVPIEQLSANFEITGILLFFCQVVTGLKKYFFINNISCPSLQYIDPIELKILILAFSNGLPSYDIDLVILKYYREP